MSNGRSDLVDIACEIKSTTDKAVLIFDGDKEVWVPKSLVEYEQEEGVVTMPEWLAKDKGLI